MKLAIMQPYIFPYIGYFQLISAADKFVVYDNIEYTKKGWINRNRILLNGTDYLFSLPLKKDSDFLHIDKRCLADNFAEHREKLKGQLKTAYAKSPEFTTIFPLIQECLDYNDHNLFWFIHHSLKKICDFLGITTEFVISSSLPINHTLKGEEKVLAICKAMKADMYINAIGGQQLYSRDTFLKENIELKFIKTGAIAYTQFSNEFVPFLSIIDVLMFNSREKVREYLREYTLI